MITYHALTVNPQDLRHSAINIEILLIFYLSVKKINFAIQKKKSLVFWSSITLLSILDFCRHVKNVLQLHKTQKCIRENNLINIYNSSFSVNMHVVKHVYTSKRR